MEPVYYHHSYGKIDAQKPFPKVLSYLYGIPQIVIFSVCAAMIIHSILIITTDTETAAYELMTALMFFVVAFILFLVSKKHKKLWIKHKEAFYKVHPCYEQEKFYLFCRDNGLSSISTTADIARLKKFAENNNINLTEDKLIEFYNIGRNFIVEKEKQINEKENEERLNKLKEAERNLEENNKKYLNLNQNKKIIQMYLDAAKDYDIRAREYQEAYNAISSGNKAYYNLIKEKERDWAFAGGIASGIAGASAGVAAAVDAQIQNSEIRERNSALFKSIVDNSAEQLVELSNRVIRCEKDANKWRNKADLAKNLLCEELSQLDLINMIKPSVKKTEVSETGNILITVETQKANLNIFENVSAVVDGYFKAVLTDGKSNFGEAYFTMPSSGSSLSRYIKSFFINPKQGHENCNIVFAPVNLWAIEKMK